MNLLSRIFFHVMILVSTATIMLNSCLKDLDPPGDECNIFIQDNTHGKLESDICNAILKPDNTLWTWGNNFTGQAGTGTKENSNFPIKVLIHEKIIDFDLYAGMTIAADRAGNIWYWGQNMFSCSYSPLVLTPVNCSFLNEIKAIEMIGSSVHILRNDGTIWQIQIESNVESSFYEPEMISGLENVVSISNTLALNNNCTLSEIITTEPEKGGLVHVTDVAAVQNVYNRRTVILKKDGTVWAWGQNDFGQLGNGSLDHSTVPVKVKILNNIIQISANYDFNLALDEDGTVWFWGFICEWDENHNPIGINIPEKINNLDNVVLIYAGLACLAMKSDGTYWYFNPENRIPQLVSFE